MESGLLQIGRISGNIGAIDLYEALNILYKKFNEKTINADIIYELLAPVSNKIEIVLNAIEEYEKLLNRNSEANFIQSKQDGIKDPQQYHALFKQLETYLDEYNTEAGRCYDKIMVHFNNEEYKEEFNSLGNYIKNYDFKSALDQFKKLETKIIKH